MAFTIQSAINFNTKQICKVGKCVKPTKVRHHACLQFSFINFDSFLQIAVIRQNSNRTQTKIAGI